MASRLHVCIIVVHALDFKGMSLLRVHRVNVWNKITISIRCHITMVFKICYHYDNFIIKMKYNSFLNLLEGNNLISYYYDLCKN